MQSHTISLNGIVQSSTSFIFSNSKASSTASLFLLAFAVPVFAVQLPDPFVSGHWVTELEQAPLAFQLWPKWRATYSLYHSYGFNCKQKMEHILPEWARSHRKDICWQNHLPPGVGKWMDWLSWLLLHQASLLFWWKVVDCTAHPCSKSLSTISIVDHAAASQRKPVSWLHYFTKLMLLHGMRSACSIKNILSQS